MQRPNPYAALSGRLRLPSPCGSSASKQRARRWYFAAPLFLHAAAPEWLNPEDKFLLAHRVTVGARARFGDRSVNTNEGCTRSLVTLIFAVIAASSLITLSSARHASTPRVKRRRVKRKYASEHTTLYRVFRLTQCCSCLSSRLLPKI